ncbi:AraC family transcriptional regulator [Mycolicibacterium sediminis]|uniref:AraC family transcriptional regulator n=1 Tax=Mycolicibacterium sediminis TaxID=1286180 RepID=A0A7I7QNF3_9MYCO|nr:helix-turn-helix domain-containing protein [Mycolicibacterium sediminis]BBY27497.1 AraC family transcriptional regulator [Mycolicibacterium sediminis]
MTDQPSPGSAPRRDRLRELLDAVVDAANSDVADMARSSFASEFHFSRQVSRLTGEPPAALRRRVMLERAAWRLQRGEGVAAVAADEGWSSSEVFSRAFRRSYGVPPSQAADVDFWLTAPNGLHFHPPESLWLRSSSEDTTPDVSGLMVAHDVADTEYLIGLSGELAEVQWRQPISPGQVVLDWDGEEPSVGAVLDALVWTKQVWLASICGADQPGRGEVRSVADLAADHRDVAARWTAMIADHAARGRLGDTVIDALCDPPESFQLYGIVAHVLTYSAHRREVARSMLARHGVTAGRGDPLDWMRRN